MDLFVGNRVLALCLGKGFPEVGPIRLAKAIGARITLLQPEQELCGIVLGSTGQVRTRSRILSI